MTGAGQHLSVSPFCPIELFHYITELTRYAMIMHLQELDSSQLATRITQFPSLLAFFGYVFYFPGILVGPSVEFTYYDQLVTGKLFASAPAVNGSGRRVPEGRKRVAYQKFLLGLFFLAVFAVAGGNMDYDRILEPQFRQRGFILRCVFTCHTL